MTAPLIVTAGSSTHAGLRRALNEDAMLATTPVFVVADGMGGHEAGERASAAVVAEFSPFIGRQSLELDDILEVLGRSRDAVEALSVGASGRAGTTLSGVVLADVDGMGYWLSFNIGDSRTYRLSGGELEQISVDHSVVQELIDAGVLDGESAGRDSRRNEITRAIGGGSGGEADFWLVPAEPGDRMLICSDGLSGEVSAERIAEVLGGVAGAQEAATRLVHEAMLHGGRDNITAVVVDALHVAGHDDDAYETAPAGTASDADGDTQPRSAARGGA